MSTNGMVGKGTTISVGNEDSPLTFTPIGEITDFEGQDGQTPIADATHLGSTHKEKLPGIPDEGKFSFTANMYPDDAGQVLLRTYRNNRALVDWKVVLPQGTIKTATFAGYLTGLSFSGSADDVVKVQATVEISGAVSWA